ncbi:MAG: P-loop NTPase [Myxococcota bacterium]
MDLRLDTRLASSRPRIEKAVAVVSGKGGVGKTNLVANLAVAAARLDARVLAVDGDLSLANVDVLLGLVPRHTLADVLEGHCRLDEAILRGPDGVHLLPASAARPELATLPGSVLDSLAKPIAEAARSYDLVLVDGGAGIGPTVVGLADLCDRILVVTTPEPTSLADAYATVKVLAQQTSRREVEVLVNASRTTREAHECFDHLRRLADRFLGLELRHFGSLPHDTRLSEAVSRQRAVVDLYPNAPSSKRLVSLAQRLLDRQSGGRGASAEGWRRLELSP